MIPFDVTVDKGCEVIFCLDGGSVTEDVCFPV